MSSGIAFVCMLAVLCGASGVLVWSRAAAKRDTVLAERFFARQMDAAGTRTLAEPMEARVARSQQRRAQRQAAEANGERAQAWRALSNLVVEIESLMRRADVRKPRQAITIWAMLTGVLALVGATRVGHAMAPAAIVIGALCFYALLNWRAQKRNQRIVRQLPSFLDSIVRMVAIGNSVPAALLAACGNAEAPLRECLDDVLPRLRTGVDVDQALAGTARIYRVREFELIGAVLRISTKFGGRSDVMLDRMASFMRDMEQADRELLALSTETRLSSWVLGLLPVVLGVGVIVISPSYFQTMWGDELGKSLVYGAFGLQALGAYLLYRLARLR